jgi:hypothetical protein
MLGIWITIALAGIALVASALFYLWPGDPVIGWGAVLFGLTLVLGGLLQILRWLRASSATRPPRWVRTWHLERPDRWPYRRLVALDEAVQIAMRQLSHCDAMRSAETEYPGNPRRYFVSVLLEPWIEVWGRRIVTGNFERITGHRYPDETGTRLSPDGSQNYQWDTLAIKRRDLHRRIEQLRAFRLAEAQ